MVDQNDSTGALSTPEATRPIEQRSGRTDRVELNWNVRYDHARRKRRPFLLAVAEPLVPPGADTARFPSVPLSVMAHGHGVELAGELSLSRQGRTRLNQHGPDQN